MTSQVADMVFYKDRELTLISASNGKIIHPSEYGIDLRGLSTNRRKGWNASYSIRDNKLYLDKLIVEGVFKSFSAIHGVLPELVFGRLKEEGMGRGEYLFSRFKQDYSGTLYLGGMDGKVLGTRESVLLAGSLEPELDVYLKLVLEEGNCVSVEEEIKDNKKILDKDSADRRRTNLRKFLNEK